MNVIAVVVTYNRRILLERCLDALAQQSTHPSKVVIVDNASKDGTLEWLRGWLPSNLTYGLLLELKENVGGAGGFAAGLEWAIKAGAEWVWMMDDDAAPHPGALRQLLAIADNPSNIYGSLAVSGTYTSWPTTLLDETRTTELALEIPACARVESIPLLGFLVHRQLVQQIGYPDAGLFIAADDIEYCLRARRAGAEIFVAGQSQIEHPRVEQKVLHILGARIRYLRLPPWKRYYDTRNRLLIARRYYGVRLLTHTIPGSGVRLLVALLKDPCKATQLWAWCCGMFDGLLGIKGRRHDRWGIRS